MAKRALPLDDRETYPIKRRKSSPDWLSYLSEELLLRMFSSLSVQDLNICQRVSRHFQKIAVDSHLWKAAYYDRFIRPRLLRIPGRRRTVLDSATLPHSSRSSKWLDEGYLVQRGQHVDWKRRYKVRHNWACGTCDVRQIAVDTRRPSPPILARLHDGIVYTVDKVAGLRAWSYKDERRLLASQEPKPLKENAQEWSPRSFALNAQAKDPNEQLLAIGNEDGSFHVHCYHKSDSSFETLHTHIPSPNGAITAIAINFPYIVVMADSHTLSLYKLPPSSLDDKLNVDAEKLPSLQLLASLKSHTVWPPLALSLRTTNSTIIASIAYSLPSYQSGWSVGIQELHLDASGNILSSRIASALSQGFTPLTSDPLLLSGTPMAQSSPPSTSPARSTSSSTNPQSQPSSKPTSLSYSHPYILLSHSDNTLTLYMATSTTTSLCISAGRRLFGHTSSVFSAHVEGRGKAVSVGTQENDIRVWELEGTTMPNSSNCLTRTSEDVSIRINPASTIGSRPATPQRLATLSEAMMLRGDGLGLADERLLTKGWVGFDDESLIVLREHECGGQALAVYDFS